MANTKKLIQAAAGSAGGAALNVEDVFSTYLYEGNDSTQTITNEIDLDGEGGLVWLKTRDDTHSHYLFDTERGAGYYLNSDTSGAQAYHATAWVTGFNSDGFDIGTSVAINDDANDHASWTFRKAPRFFDCVTWTGTGSTQSISHNLDSQIGFMAVKATSYADNWYAFHRQMANPSSYTQPYLRLNDTFGVGSLGDFGTSVNLSNTSSFQVSGNINLSGVTYVAYLWAHNNNDGEFGSTEDQDIIKCGSFTSTSGTDEIDLGFEPQWILIKRADASNSWVIVDEMRGNPVGSAANYLEPNGSFAESTLTGWTTPTPTGFTNSYPLAGGTFIYVAIRRGPMAVPTTATDVFDVAERGADSPPPLYRSGFVTDMFINRADVTLGGHNYVLDRLRGELEVLLTAATDAEAAYGGAAYGFDVMDGIGNFTGLDSNNYSWMWRRAPNYFDVVAEPIASAQMSGPASSSYNPSHNLGVTPEMIWVKDRDNSDNWYVYHSALGTSQKLILNSTAAASSSSWAVASDNFNFYAFGNSTGNAICYLFASLDGVSKVGSYTGDGTTNSTKVIDCGFSSGARFVLIKCSSAVHDWYVLDTERGIVAGNDPALQLNTTSAEITSSDLIDPDSSGFIVGTSFTSMLTFNQSNETYIFYAIA